MVKLLTEAEIDPIADEVDTTMTAAEEQAAAAAVQGYNPTAPVSDLSDGGHVGGVTVNPKEPDGRVNRGKHTPDRVIRGRPAARQAWMWNGSETTLPLAWNPEGTMHDGARRYLLKRHCTCCNTSGFRGAQCPTCFKSNCEHCHGSTDPSKAIPCFYLRKESVPFPSKFYGNVDCFLPTCPRRGSQGFLTGQDMRVHAASRHKMEYKAYLEGIQASRVEESSSLREELDSMRKQLEVLTERGIQASPDLVEAVETIEEQPTVAEDRMAKARAAKATKHGT